MPSLDIGIVGGSIAGCSAACLFARAGHRVTVFERSTGSLVGRGGGIGTPTPMLQTLIDEGLLDGGFPYLQATTMPFVIRTADEPYAGRRPWQLNLDFAAFHWSALWHHLRARVPDGTYHAGEPIVRAEETGGRVTVENGSGTRATFDLVLFADGYQSMGRALLFPDARLEYRGYMLWRGLLSEEGVTDSHTLGSTMPRVSYRYATGNCVMYFVPGHDGRVEPGRRLVNWAAYIELPEADLGPFMVDAEGRSHIGTLPPGCLRPAEEARLKTLMSANLPRYYGEIIRKTSHTYVQLIYTADLPAYRRGRMALIGDAGIVAQPFTGSGVFKGYQNVKALLEALAREPDLDTALERWSRDQVRLGRRLLALGEQMERAFIWRPLDLSGASAADTEAWWRRSVAFPEDFTHEKAP